MEWIKINKMPENEILAANFNKKAYGYKEKIIGYLHIKEDVICCENGYELLENCSHYIDINKFDIE